MLTGLILKVRNKALEMQAPRSSTLGRVSCMDERHLAPEPLDQEGCKCSPSPKTWFAGCGPKQGTSQAEQGPFYFAAHSFLMCAELSLWYTFN